MIIECDACAGSGREGIRGDQTADICLDCQGTGEAWDGLVLRAVYANKVEDWPCRIGEDEDSGCLLVLDWPGDKHPCRIRTNDWSTLDAGDWHVFLANLLYQVVGEDALSIEVIP